MNFNFKYFTLAALMAVSIFSCQKVPLTGRKQLVGLVSNDSMISMSLTQFKSFTDTSKVLPVSSVQSQSVEKVGNRIKTAVETYLNQNNLSHLLNGYQWEFKTVESKELNAWCMPGGKVCFYSAILPVCQNENGIAVVMGHEVSHAIAEHGRERMNRALVASGITQVGAIAAGVATNNQQIMGLAGAVLGIGANVGTVLPNSRKQESEADKLGLIFMSMAGYDPHEAVAFWKRMMEAGKNTAKPPKLLSTHPADEDRISSLEKQMDDAMKYYNASLLKKK